MKKSLLNFECIFFQDFDEVKCAVNSSRTGVAISRVKRHHKVRNIKRKLGQRPSVCFLKMFNYSITPVENHFFFMAESGTKFNIMKY